MNRDILFLLKHDFPEDAERYYCPECAEMNGVLAYYPALRHQLDVRYVNFPRPRTEVISLVGAANQSCPVLILAGRPATDLAGITLGEHAGRHFISGSRDIATYLARAHGSGLPH